MGILEEEWFAKYKEEGAGKSTARCLFHQRIIFQRAIRSDLVVLQYM
jgi:hypothetical protein